VRRFAFGNIAGNVLLFIPLRSDLSVLTKSTVARTMLIVASTSVAVEILQGVFALGASDIDDVILNCLGGFIGIQLFLLLRVIVRDRDRVRTVVAVLSVVATPGARQLTHGRLFPPGFDWCDTHRALAPISRPRVDLKV